MVDHPNTHNSSHGTSHTSGDEKNIQDLWDSLKTNGDRYKPIWDDISKFTGITLEPDYLWHNNKSKDRQLDEFVDDPTSAISVNQAGDYLIGIMWGSGEDVFDIVPSRYVLELADQAEVEEWYKFATDQALYHMNHNEAGLHTALRPYAYDQMSFGTSGIGCFPNNDFKLRLADNALVFRNYGVDNTRIDEGKSGVPDIVGCTYHWRLNRIVKEFASTGGSIDNEKMAKMPKAIQKAWTANRVNDEFDIVCLVFPRADFDPRLKGKRGTKYRGVWYMDQANERNIFFEEDFKEKPIAMARQIKVRGEVYGRSSGTLLISSIRAVNFMVGTVIEILEKMSNPSLGVFNNAIFGDSVIDTSPNGMTVFNSALAANKGAPIFPVHDVGDPSGIINFLIPYLNDKVATAFKIDALLDFNSGKDMTATESLHRFAIRGKSISGMLQQQKTEGVEPFTKRSISVLLDMGELGVDPDSDAARAKALRDRGKEERVIPESVLEIMKAGRPWFELKFNNEMEKLMRTEAVQNLLQVLQTITVIASVHPEIVEAVNWYKLLKEINDNLDYNSQILLSEADFKKKVGQVAEARSTALKLQAAGAGAAIQKDTAQANKTNKEADNVGRQ